MIPQFVKTPLLLAALVLLLPASFAKASTDPVFSGPQVGEKITPFKILDTSGPSAGKEREIVPSTKKTADVLVFVSAVERSIVPLMTVIDQYASEKRDSLKTEFIFLTDDRIATAKRLPLVAKSLHMQCPMSLSTDGPEGPGNYGLNKSVLMTILVATNGRVTANFALVQPGMTDGPAVIAAMAKACGDTTAPTPEVLRERRNKAAGAAPVRDNPTSMPARAAAGKKADLPGAAPTDEKLLAMLRSFIQKDNDDATVDRIAQQVEQYVKNDPDLTRQAVGGWTRVIYLKYGTDYALKTGEKLVERLKK